MIGNYFVPRKDHSTIIHSYRKIVNGYAYDPKLRHDLGIIKNMCIDMNRFENIVNEIMKLEESYSEILSVRQKNRITAWLPTCQNKLNASKHLPLIRLVR